MKNIKVIFYTRLSDLFRLLYMTRSVTYRCFIKTSVKEESRNDPSGIFSLSPFDI
jgi:hypothetical protein